MASGTMPSAAKDPTTGPTGSRRFWPIVTTIALVIAIVLLLGDAATSSPRLCASCHEMDAAHQTWSESAHTSVGCVSCHETPRPWYGRPLTLIERGRLLTKDVIRHLTGRYGEPADTRALGRWSPMPDDICLRCHDPNRKATSGFRILIDHVEHAERTGACVACHVHTAHPDPFLGRPLSLMEQCLDCHGTPEQPEASDECGTCHPADFDLKPPSHAEEPWMRDHGFTAVAEPAVCVLCHQQGYCDSCHGVQMPHPEGWVGGAESHAAHGKIDRTLCRTCHTGQADPCLLCHHDTYGVSDVPWKARHNAIATVQGTARCLECHPPTYCVTCHKDTSTVP